VGESATEVDGRLVWGRPKTYARRTVHLPRFLCEQPAAYLAERPHGPDELVFTAPQGGSLREQKFVAGILKPAAARAELPTGCGSMLREPAHRPGRERQGAPGPVRLRLGHGDVGPLRAPVPR
jgi:hypothetical protein